jgi:hypothetical protein
MVGIEKFQQQIAPPIDPFLKLRMKVDGKNRKTIPDKRGTMHVHTALTACMINKFFMNKTEKRIIKLNYRIQYVYLISKHQILTNNRISNIRRQFSRMEKQQSQ